MRLPKASALVSARLCYLGAYELARTLARRSGIDWYEVRKSTLAAAPLEASGSPGSRPDWISGWYPHPPTGYRPLESGRHALSAVRLAFPDLADQVSEALDRAPRPLADLFQERAKAAKRQADLETERARLETERARLDAELARVGAELDQVAGDTANLDTEEALRLEVLEGILTEGVPA